jgi:hypothetical protein
MQLFQHPKNFISLGCDLSLSILEWYGNVRSLWERYLLQRTLENQHKPSQWHCQLFRVGNRLQPTRCDVPYWGLGTATQLLIVIWTQRILYELNEWSYQLKPSFVVGLNPEGVILFSSSIQGHVHFHEIVRDKFLRHRSGFVLHNCVALGIR